MLPGTADRVAVVAAGRGVKPTQVALAWLLSTPTVSAPIIGVTKLEHINDAARAVSIVLEPDEIASLEVACDFRPPADG